MNTPRVVITVVNGLLHHTRYVFTEARRCIVGMEDGGPSHLRLNDELHDATDRHCVLEIDPPCVRIRDSRGDVGIVVNGELAGPQAELRDGDEVWVGDLLLSVCVEGVSASALAPAGG